MSSPDDNMRLCRFSLRVRAFILQKIACALLRFLLTKQHNRRARLDVPMPACISSTMPPCGRAAVCASCFDPSFFGIVNLLRSPCCGNAVLLAPCAIHRCAGLLTFLFREQPLSPAACLSFALLDSRCVCICGGMTTLAPVAPPLCPDEAPSVPMLGPTFFRTVNERASVALAVLSCLHSGQSTGPLAFGVIFRHPRHLAIASFLRSTPLLSQIGPQRCFLLGWCQGHQILAIICVLPCCCEHRAPQTDQPWLDIHAAILHICHVVILANRIRITLSHRGIQYHKMGQMLTIPYHPCHVADICDAPCALDTGPVKFRHQGWIVIPGAKQS